MSTTGFDLEPFHSKKTHSILTYNESLYLSVTNSLIQELGAQNEDMNWCSKASIARNLTMVVSGFTAHI